MAKMQNTSKKKNTKKGKQGGFTLIELLAVITIMGILMMVAIPSVSRTIDNTRRDTFKDTAGQYISAVKTLWISEGLYCRTGSATQEASTLPSALSAGKYYVLINTQAKAKYDSDCDTSVNCAASKPKNNAQWRYYPTLVEQGGTSSWGNGNVAGYVQIQVTGNVGAQNRKVEYSVLLTDTNGHGIGNLTPESKLSRAVVKPSGQTLFNVNGGVTAEMQKTLCYSM